MNFEVGDRVVFKTWDEMLDEYGTTDDGESIACQYNFTHPMEMEIDKSKVFTISHLRGNGGVNFEEEGTTGLPGNYTYSIQMIKLYHEMTEEEKANRYDISPWAIHRPVEGHEVDCGIRGTRNFLDVIHSILITQENLYLSSDILHNSYDDLVNYTLSQGCIRVALYAIGYNYFEEAQDEDRMKVLGNGKVKLYHDNANKDVYILFIADNLTDFNDKALIMDIVDYFSEIVPKEDEIAWQIIDCLKSENPDGAVIRDEYIKRTQEQRRFKQLYAVCDEVQPVLATQRVESLKENVNRLDGYVEEARREYQRAVTNLNNAKKEYSFAKYNSNKEEEDSLVELLKQDVKDERLIKLQVDSEYMNFLIVEDLLFFDEDDWELVRDGVIEEAYAEEYYPVLNAIFTRKCIITIEQGAKLYLDPVNSHDQVQRYVFGDPVYGVPNSHMQRYNCWDQNGSNCYEYICKGDYALAYTQIKSAIAGINVTDNPVMIDFCGHIGRYRDIDCIRDSETGEVMTIAEANDYYKDKE